MLPAAVTQLLGQVLSKSKAALKLTGAVLAVSPGASGLGLISRALQRLCEEEGPVVCVIETPDGNAGGLWADLVGLFARRIAKDLPLLLVFALDGGGRRARRAQRGAPADQRRRGRCYMAVASAPDHQRSGALDWTVRARCAGLAD